MISADFYPTLQTYADGEIERTDIINNLYSNDNVGSPYYLGYIEHDDFPKSFGVSILDYSQGMAFKRVESNHSWGFCFNKNVFNTTGTSPSLFVVQDSTGHAENGGDRYCFLNKIKMAQQNFDSNVTYTAYIMYIPTSSIDDTYSAPFANYATSSISRTVTVEQLKDIIEDTSNVLNAWTSSSKNYPDVKYSDFNEYGLALVQSTDSTMTAAICIAQVSIAESGRYSYGESSNVRSAVFPFFEHDTEDKHIITSQGSGYVLNPKVLLYYDLGIIRPSTNFAMEYSGQFYTAQPYPYDINMSDLPMPSSTYQTSVLVKGQYFLKWYSSATFSHINYDIFAHYDLKDVYALMLYYHKIYTSAVVFSKSYTTDVSVATFNDHDGATGDRLSDDYANIDDQLRDWQQPDTNIAVNNYDPADKPPYNPGGDGDDQGSNTGSILRPTTLGVGGTNGFITQYSLTAAQIAEIGRLLWLSFTDPDYYKNFLFTLTTTGTLNISNLLDYFVSLRVYPFPLINVPSHAAAGQDMWIGAGLVPLSFKTNLHTINNYADYIDAGSCTIPRYYNDFRDFAHTQIMLYLPYCGTVQLNPADVVGATLHAQYAVDFATGGVTAYVDCTTWDGSQFVIAVLTGSIGADIPLTASNAAQIAARIAGDALNFAGTVGEAVSADVGRSAQAIGSAATGDVVGAAIGVANTYAGRIGGALDVAQTGLQIATAEGVKMPMLSGGRGFGSFGAPQTAYVQIRRGIYAEGQQPPQGFKEAYGEAYSKPVQVSSCTGFTVFANVDTSGLQCDAMEREQVKKMMQAGIYI